MKRIALPFVAAAGLFAAAGAAGAQAPWTEHVGQHTCLWTYNIDHTHVVNPRTLLFYMKDGNVWRNDLKGACPGLKFHGFTYVTRSDQICGPEIGIRVLRTGEVCSLGEFRPWRADMHAGK
jgi:hypothetical protein